MYAVYTTFVWPAVFFVPVCNDNYENSNLKLKPKFATKARVGRQTTSDSSIPTVLPSWHKNDDSIPAPAHWTAPT